MILQGEIKDAKMSSFSSDFQTFIKQLTFPLYFLYELLMNLRSKEVKMTIYNSLLRLLKQFHEANKLHDTNAPLSLLHVKITVLR